ncbi:MAG: GNAT family N-acetyltransferase [Jatrophihabitans sp.]
MVNLSFRCLPDTSAEQVDLFVAATPDPDRWRADLTGCFAEGSLHPEWCWQAVDGAGTVRACLYWWGRPGAAEPSTLIAMGRDDLAASVALVQQSRDVMQLRSARVGLTIPNLDERSVEAVHPEYTALLAATGFRRTVERVRLEWREEYGRPERRSRLSFVPARDRPEAELITVLTDVLDGTLDEAMRTGAADVGVQAHAAQMLDDFLLYPGPSDWFALALSEGVPVGYVIASTMDAPDGILAELGVARAHRGQGYAGELLAHGTELLAGAGFGLIRSDTDCANTPMRTAFAAGGYREFARRFDYRWVR